jgi:hypothetical protein
MFLTLARWFQEHDQASNPGELEGSASKVFELHPIQLARALEEAYFAKDDSLRGAFPSPALPFDIVGRQLPSGLDRVLANVPDDIYPLADRADRQSQPLVWHHLIYAYMIEQTRVFEIFDRVLFHYLYGEQLPPATGGGQRWLRATEDLLFRDAPSFQIYAVTSWLRPDIRASRRNAYMRLFGLDLDHGKLNFDEHPKDSGSYPYPHPREPGWNKSFFDKFEEFVRQVWRGIENVVNTSGPNPTDDAAIATLADDLRIMLADRRKYGNLAREEFIFASMMSWLHLTLLFDSQIVKDLKAEASAPWERLAKIGDLVEVPAHKHSEGYFRIAEPLSRLLIGIEAGLFNHAGTVPALYSPGAPHDDIFEVITQWLQITGHDLKAPKVAVSGPMPRDGVMPPVGEPAPGSPILS